MAFSVKFSMCCCFFYFLFILEGKGFSGRIFHNLTFKCMDALKKKIQHLVDVASNYCSWTHVI